MLGTAARLGLTLTIPDVGGVPAAIIVVNVVGALLIGVLAARLPASSDRRVFLGTGILGGFTTYSAFAVGSVELWAATPLLAVLYAFLSLVLGFAAAFAGMRLAAPRKRA
ncbi:CrcB family protein [Microbacterium tumbae]